MTDEEVLRIAQELSWEDWWALADTQDGGNWYEARYDFSLIKKGLLEHEVADLDHWCTHTELGARVWAWSPVFYDRGTK